MTQFGHQPGSGHLPVGHNGLWRDFQDFGCIFDAEAAKELELHDLGFAGIDLFQLAQGVIDSDEPLAFGI